MVGHEIRFILNRVRYTHQNIQFSGIAYVVGTRKILWTSSTSGLFNCSPASRQLVGMLYSSQKNNDTTKTVSRQEISGSLPNLLERVEGIEPSH